ncbi:MAG: glycosyltransferase [Microbacter sp.]
MMHLLVDLSFGFVVLQLLNALLNVVFRQNIGKSASLHGELISILIPARNEEANIGKLLESLHAIKNDRIEVLVYDDHSTDRTASIVQSMSAKDDRIRLVQPVALPQGWLGKNHACFMLAQHAKGSFLLFVDADVQLFGTIVEDSVEYMKKKKLGLMSVFPKQIQLTLGEKLTVPLMNYILLTLLPLIFVRISPFKSHAAANGQFMLFEAGWYKKIQPHSQVKSSAVEDILIARLYKQHHIPVACITGEKSIQCRMYASYRDAFNGFSKNILMFFGNMPIVAFLFGFLAAFGFVPLLLMHSALLWWYLIVVLCVQILYSWACRQPVSTALFYFPVHLFFLFQVLINALRMKRKKNYTWKGRQIYS